MNVLRIHKDYVQMKLQQFKYKFKQEIQFQLEKLKQPSAGFPYRFKL